MTVLLTGSAGYIGTRLAQSLVEYGHTVIGVDRKEACERSLKRQITSDLVSAVDWWPEEESIDCVCHLAAAKGDWGIAKDEYFRDNVDATRCVLDAGRKAGVRDWVFFSSVSALGPSEVALDESAPRKPIDPYGESKAEAEDLFHDHLAHNPSARILIIRPSVVFGPENPASTNIYRLIEAIYRKRFVFVGDRDVKKSTSYIGNLVPATLFLMDNMKAGVQVYNYIDEPVMCTWDMVTAIYQALDKEPLKKRIPLRIASKIAHVLDIAASITGVDFPITAARIDKFNRHTNIDAGLIRSLGFKQPYSFQEAIVDTVRWHIERYR